MPKFGTKNALFGCSWGRILKNYCHIWNQHLRISVIAKFYEEKRCLNLGPEGPNLGIFGEELKKLLSYLKSATSNLSNCKIFGKTKVPKFRTKNVLFVYFWARILQIWVFNSYSEFWYRVAFFLRSALLFFWRSVSGSAL